MGLVALAGTTVGAVASDAPVAIVTNPGPGLITPMRQAQPDKLIQTSTMRRHMVGIVMRDDVVAPEVIQVQMGNLPIFVDPDRDYNRDTGGIDMGHTIMRAQRTYRALTARGASVIYRVERDEVTEEETRIKPRAILLRPDFLERRDPKSAPKAAPTPLTPEVKRGPVASAN